MIRSTLLFLALWTLACSGDRSPLVAETATTVASSDKTADKPSAKPSEPPGASSAGQKEPGFRPLFNGKNLTGWRPINTAPSTWTWKEDRLHCTGKPIGELRTERMYQNFILELEWRHLKPRGNAGIFVWADDITARGQPFHRGIEVQVLENAYGNTRNYTTHGDIFPIHGARMTPVNGRGGQRAFPTENRSKPSPEWNHYRIECRDGEISLAVNGKVVTRGKNCVPRKGYICLESEGGVVDYRKVRLKELPSTPLTPDEIAQVDRGYRCLYNGIDLRGWKTSAAGEKYWKPKDWVLAWPGAPKAKPPIDGVLRTSESFGDFGFILDFRLSRDPRPLRLRLRNDPKHDLFLTRDTPELAPWLAEGRGWNRLEGRLEGDRLSLRLNEQEICRDRELAGLAPRGPFALVPGGPVEVANPYVRSLPKKPATRKPPLKQPATEAAKDPRP